jgi:hypothetical protein
LKQNDVGYSCDDKSIFAMWAQTERGIRLQFRSGFDQPSPNATLTIVQSSGPNLGRAASRTIRHERSASDRVFYHRHAMRRLQLASLKDAKALLGELSS